MNIIIYNIKGIAFQWFDRENYFFKNHSDLLYAIINKKTEKEVFFSSFNITSVKIEEKL